MFVSYCNQLLRFGQRQGLPKAWRPHPEPSEPVGPMKATADGVPITDIELLELLADLPDTPRARKWRFAIQLMAVTVCRASEINLVRVVDGRLLCETETDCPQGRHHSPLAILPVALPAGGTTDFDIVARLEEGEALPDAPYRQPVGFLRTNSDFGCSSAISTPAGKRLVPSYCLRYRWIATAHRHGLPVSYMAELAGHQPETAGRSTAASIRNPAGIWCWVKCWIGLNRPQRSDHPKSPASGLFAVMPAGRHACLPLDRARPRLAACLPNQAASASLPCRASPANPCRPVGDYCGVVERKGCRLRRGTGRSAPPSVESSRGSQVQALSPPSAGMM